MSDAEKHHLEQLAKLEAREKTSPPRRVQDAVPASAQVILEDRVFLRTFAKRSFFLTSGMAAVCVILTIALVYVFTRPPLTLSYLQDSQGNLVALRPLDQTELSEAEILAWAADRILQLQKFSFADYSDHLGGLRDDFVPETFVEYQRALINNKTVDRVKNDKLVKYAVPIEAPVLQSMKKINGVMTWVITMKIREFMAGGNYSSSSTELKAEITIRRTNKAINLDGIRISKYLVTKAGGGL